jgi:hypothetical protein
MTSAYSSTLATVSGALDEYTGVLRSIEQVTDDLIALGGPHKRFTPRVLELVASRQELCDAFGPAACRLSQAMRELRKLTDAPACTVDPEVLAIRKAFDDLPARHRALLDKQATCERLHRDRADACWAEIVRRGRNASYLNGYRCAGTKFARYLDKRL